MSSQLLVSQMEKKNSIMASFLAAGKGRAISFTLDPEREAEITRQAKYRAAVKYFTAYFEVEQRPPGRPCPTSKYSVWIKKRDKLVNAFMADLECWEDLEVEAWYLPRMRLECNTQPVNDTEDVEEGNESLCLSQTYYSRIPAVKRIYNDTWHNWTKDGKLS
ncbi:hypothetical protein HDU99_002673, partial [Rhizoclosmatium hyalinum]